VLVVGGEWEEVPNVNAWGTLGVDLISLIDLVASGELTAVAATLEQMGVIPKNGTLRDARMLFLDNVYRLWIIR
jgi:hypothetical protein